MKYIVQPVFLGSANTPGLTPGKTYTIAAAHSGKVMAVRNNTIQIEQQNWDEDTDQQWQIEALDGDNVGFFRIKNVGASKYLDLDSGSKKDGAKIQVWDWNGNHNQQWKVNFLEDGTFSIISRASGKPLDVSGKQQKQGAIVHQWTWYGGDNQRWRLSTLQDVNGLYAFNPRVTIYEHVDYDGQSQELGIGSYNIRELSIGNDKLSSINIPDGVRVTLYEHADFKGNTFVLTENNPNVDHFNERTSSILVESVVTIAENSSFGGKKQYLGVGKYKPGDLTIGDKKLSSIKVPFGMVAYLYERADFKGRMWAYTENEDFLAKFNDKVSSIIVRMSGIPIPESALKFGSKIYLHGYHGKYLRATPEGKAFFDAPHRKSWEELEIVRAGSTKLRNNLSFGDKIALKTGHGTYLTATADGQLNCGATQIGDMEKFEVVRSGPSLHGSFVSLGDTIALRSHFDKLVVAEENGDANANRTHMQPWERFIIHSKEKTSGTVSAPCGVLANCTHNASTFPTPCGAAACYADYAIAAACGAAAYGVSVCGAAACGADACAAAACGADGALVSVCGVAASGVVICAADAAVVSVCAAAAGGVTACGADVCGAAACAAAACGAAACAAAACGADACGGAACGIASGGVGAAVLSVCSTDYTGATVCAAEACFMNACGTAACAADACQAKAAAIDACPADACGANACAINLCPIDACAADACLLDVVPIIPGI